MWWRRLRYEGEEWVILKICFAGGGVHRGVSPRVRAVSDKSARMGLEVRVDEIPLVYDRERPEWSAPGAWRVEGLLEGVVSGG